MKLQNIKLIFKKSVIFEHHIKRMKNRNHVTILIDAEKASGKMLRSRVMKTVNGPGTAADRLSAVQAERRSPRLTSRDVADERLGAVPLSSGSKPLSAPLPNTALDVLARAHRDSKKWTFRFGGKKKERQRGTQKEPNPKARKSP